MLYCVSQPAVMIFDHRSPDVFAAKRWWSREEVDAKACRWRAEILSAFGDGPRPIAVVLPVSDDGVALFVALSACPSPVILLSPTASAWRSDPPIPRGTPLVLPSSLGSLESEARRIDCIPLVVSESGKPSGGPPMTTLQTPGIVHFTSGSTGLPKPVFRTMGALVAAASARLSALDMRSGDGILTSASLAHGQGLMMLLSAILLGGPLGLLGPVDHRSALATLAMPQFKFWWATPHFADALGRCRLTGTPVVPPICLVSSPITARVFSAFVGRFGVPLRQSYSTSETGAVAVNDAPPSAVSPQSVGRPLAGVEVRIGTHPDSARGPGESGRIWVRSPWQMSGYGFPPKLQRQSAVDGWWPTEDIGSLDAEGRLALHGRLDDCIRTREGRLVNLAAVAHWLREIEGVTDAVAVPLEGPIGYSFGAVVECRSTVSLTTLRRGLADALPEWSHPREMALVPLLPRLPNGKPDRRACRAILDSPPVS
jgi:acyl-coenzyme A synthetase/AMP-(fatty) acid ligase